MKFSKAIILTIALFLTVATFSACSSPAQAPDITEGIQRGFNSFGWHDITVTQDREKGIVTLGGHVASETEKTQAESLAKSMSVNDRQTVVNQIAVVPPAPEAAAKDATTNKPGK